jgi:hypothetical protein
MTIDFLFINKSTYIFNENVPKKLGKYVIVRKLPVLLKIQNR